MTLCKWWRVLVSAVVMEAETMACPAMYPHILHALHPLCALIPEQFLSHSGVCPPLLLFLWVPMSLAVPPRPLVQAAQCQDWDVAAGAMPGTVTALFASVPSH